MRILRIIVSRINRMWILVAVAIILGVAATWVTTQYIKVREQRIEADAKKRASGGATVSVVVPIRDLPKGTGVDSSVVAARDILVDLVYDGETVLADNFGKVEGLKLVHPVQKGRPLRLSDLDTATKQFSDVLPEGTRAITIDVDEINSVAQMVRPGNRVDLMLIMTDPNDPAGGQQIMSLLQKVKVIATGQLLVKAAEREGGAPGAPAAISAQSAQAQRYSNITLEVTPEEAARIALAQQLGKIRAVLRNEDDTSTEPGVRLNTQTLLEGTVLAKKAGSRNNPTVEFIIGGKGGAGVGTTVNVNMPPGIVGGGATGGGNTAAPGQPSAPTAGTGSPAGPASGTGQVNIPGVGNVPFGVPFSPSPTAPASAAHY